MAAKPDALPALREPFRWSRNQWLRRWELVQDDTENPSFPPVVRGWVNYEVLDDMHPDALRVELVRMTEGIREEKNDGR